MWEAVACVGSDILAFYRFSKKRRALKCLIFSVLLILYSITILIVRMSFCHRADLWLVAKNFINKARLLHSLLTNYCLKEGAVL